MKAIISFLLLVASIYCHAQDTVNAETEAFALIPIGIQSNEIQYSSDDQGFYSPSGPFVDRDGRLTFVDIIHEGKKIEYFNNKITISNIQSSLLNGFSSGNSILFSSQQGTSYYGGYLLFNSANIVSIFDDRSYIKPYLPAKYLYPYVYQLPNAALLDYPGTRAVISLEFSEGNAKKVRNTEETISWLSFQPGGFHMDSNGVLYRYNIQWTANLPNELKDFGYEYLGRLLSGHVIWRGGRYAMESVFIITSPQGKIELQLEFPWAPSYKRKEYRPFNYGLGPWGEFYCLIAPQVQAGWPPAGSSSELVVVRNHLKFFGRLNDGGVRLRKEPSTSAESLGTYPAKTGFRILEKGTKEETIAGQKNVWYKVRLLDGKEGWFFGAFVHNLYDGPNGKEPPWPNVPDW